MNDVEIRLECLRLAKNHWSGCATEQLIEAAEAMAAFVERGETKNSSLLQKAKDFLKSVSEVDCA